MDAFEKLAKLAGASVESVGEGLPRTLAEAKALGVNRYFTGAPCLRGHVAERFVSVSSCCECNRQRDAGRERKEYMRQYMRQYNATPEVKEYLRQYSATPEVKERKRQHKLAKTGDAVLFAINQAELAACRGCATNDIVPQCPEPQRSQLQALVDPNGATSPGVQPGVERSSRNGLLLLDVLAQDFDWRTPTRRGEVRRRPQNAPALQPRMEVPEFLAQQAR